MYRLTQQPAAPGLNSNLLLPYNQTCPPPLLSSPHAACSTVVPLMREDCRLVLLLQRLLQDRLIALTSSFPAIDSASLLRLGPAAGSRRDGANESLVLAVSGYV